MFDHQSGENQGAFSKDNLKKFAEELKLDTKTFNECLDSGKYTDLVKTQTAMAQNLGVSSTPAFAINGYAMVGAQPFEAFKKIIDEKLGE